MEAKGTGSGHGAEHNFRQTAHQQKRVRFAGKAPPVRDMSLRDWFAGMAIATMAFEGSYPEVKKVAKIAYELADELMAERERGMHLI